MFKHLTVGSALDGGPRVGLDGRGGASSLEDRRWLAAPLELKRGYCHHRDSSIVSRSRLRCC